MDSSCWARLTGLEPSRHSLLTLGSRGIRRLQVSFPDPVSWELTPARFVASYRLLESLVKGANPTNHFPAIIWNVA
jgi:hypothetical protein